MREPTGIAETKRKQAFLARDDTPNRNYAEECRNAATEILEDMERCLVENAKQSDVNRWAIKAQLREVRKELKGRKGKRVCEVEGCERSVWCAGLCAMHYHRGRA